MSEEQKNVSPPIYTSRKFIIGMITMAMAILVPIIGPRFGLTIEVANEIMLAVVALGGAMIGAHAYTDAAATKAMIRVEGESQGFAGRLGAMMPMFGPLIDALSRQTQAPVTIVSSSSSGDSEPRPAVEDEVPAPSDEAAEEVKPDGD